VRCEVNHAGGAPMEQGWETWTHRLHVGSSAPGASAVWWRRWRGYTVTNTTMADVSGMPG